MRGTIIMWSGDKGVIAAADKRYDFNINQWQGSVAPAANMTVELQVSDSGALTGVAPVSEADLAKEKLNQMSAQGSKVAQAVLGNVGRDVTIAYGIFLFAALFMSVMGSSGMFGNISITVADLLSGNMGLNGLVGGSGKGTFLVLIAAATIAVPLYWKHKLAPLAFCVPLVFTLYAFYPVYQQYSQARAQAAQAGAFFGEMTNKSLDTGFSLGLGAYAALIAGAYLAFRGVTRYLGRQAG